MRPGPPRTAAVIAAAAAVAVVGAVLVWQGLVRAGAFGGRSDLMGRLSTVSRPVVVAVPGMTDLSGTRVTVAADAPDGRPVFVGIGRSDDVEAYLGAVSRQEITSLGSGGRLRSSSTGGDPSLPDPATVDVWADQARAPGTVSLTWPKVAGSWRVVVAVDGRTPPSSVQFTWSGRSEPPGAAAFLTVGVILLVAGAGAGLAVRSGRLPLTVRTSASDDRRTSDPDEVSTPTENEVGTSDPDEVSTPTENEVGTSAPDEVSTPTENEEDEAPIQPFRRRGAGSREDM